MSPKEVKVLKSLLLSPQDMYLGFEGTELGVNLMQGKIKPMEVGDYILNTLSEGTETARYWDERHSKLQEVALMYTQIFPLIGRTR
jgi:hypothetical protein